jgi:enolase-phosphatase E1
LNAASTFLLDIEGTTTPVTFVTDVLFPYARHRLREFLMAHAHEPQVEAQLQALERERAHETAADAPPAWPAGDRIAGACAYLEWLMDRDRKATPLKALQGMIWEHGYRSGELVAPVYDDVAPAFARWRAAGRAIAIFSSGSVLAQKLLFAHSSAGDLTRFVSAWFDTTTGPKQQPESYRGIAGALGTPSPQVLFVSDVAEEVEAAASAGMQSALCIRPGTAQPQLASLRIIHSFDDVP